MSRGDGVPWCSGPELIAGVQVWCGRLAWRDVAGGFWGPTSGVLGALVERGDWESKGY